MNYGTLYVLVIIFLVQRGTSKKKRGSMFILQNREVPCSFGNKNKQKCTHRLNTDPTLQVCFHVHACPHKIVTVH